MKRLSATLREQQDEDKKMGAITSDLIPRAQ